MQRIECEDSPDFGSGLPTDSPRLGAEEIEYVDSMSKRQTEDLLARIRVLEQVVKKNGEPATDRPREGWPKRNAWWLAWVVAALPFVLGSGFILSHVRMLIDERITAKLEGPLADLHKLQTDVGEIRGELKRIAARATIQDAAGLTPTQLARSLPELREAIREAKKTNLVPPEESISSIQSKLLKINTSAPDYWPLAFDLISYHSILISGLTTPPKVSATDMRDVFMVGGNNGVKGGYVRLGGVIQGVRFVESWVEFDVSRPVVLKDVRFERCVLVFVGMDLRTPSPSIQRLGTQLLEANIAHFAIKG